MGFPHNARRDSPNSYRQLPYRRSCMVCRTGDDQTIGCLIFPREINKLQPTSPTSIMIIYFPPAQNFWPWRSSMTTTNALKMYGIIRQGVRGGYLNYCEYTYDYVIKWKHFPRYWPFKRGIHRSPVNSPHKGQWRGALMFSLICVWTNGWVNNREAGDLRRYRADYDVIVMVNANKWFHLIQR